MSIVNLMNWDCISLNKMDILKLERWNFVTLEKRTHNKGIAVKDRTGITIEDFRRNKNGAF